MPIDNFTFNTYFWILIEKGGVDILGRVDMGKYVSGVSNHYGSVIDSYCTPSMKVPRITKKRRLFDVIRFGSFFLLCWSQILNSNTSVLRGSSLQLFKLHIDCHLLTLTLTSVLNWELKCIQWLFSILLRWIYYHAVKFDSSILQVSVDYLTKPLEVFKEMRRILKPGGLVIMR